MGVSIPFLHLRWCSAPRDHFLPALPRAGAATGQAVLSKSNSFVLKSKELSYWAVETRTGFANLPGKKPCYQRDCLASSLWAYKTLALSEILCVPVVGAGPGLGRAPGKWRGDAESSCAMGNALGSGCGELGRSLKLYDE